MPSPDPQAGSRLQTIFFVALLALTFTPLGVFAQGNLGSVLQGLKKLDKFYQLYKTHQKLFDQLAVGGVTVLVPTNEAFEKQQGLWDQMDEDLITATLRYHVLKDELRTSDIVRGDIVSKRTLLDDPRYTNVTGGQQVLVTKQPDDSVVVTSGFWTRGTIAQGHENIAFNNGVIQVIDAVMRVPLPLAATARDSYTDMTAFVGALYNLDIYDAFNDMTDVTLFVPYNKAFQQLAGRFESMDKAAFREVLRYHAIPDQLVHGWELKNGSTLSTASQGPKKVPLNSTITRDGNIIYINSAQVVVTDMLISNGIVHVIDNVLSPTNETARPNLTGTQTPVFAPTGATSVGPNVPTPFAEDIPCTKDCPEPEATAAPTSTSTFKPAVPTSNAVAPQFTGLTGHGLGLAALGALVVL